LEDHYYRRGDVMSLFRWHTLILCCH